jgi:glycosyltransferase involved in cell wall biosynthesis
VDTPSISVLTPTYNSARFLRDTLRSVRLQEAGGGVEHVAVDDGSTDDSIAILEEQGDRIVFSANAHVGLAGTMNAALRLARGSWVGWLNADDFYLPGVLAGVMRHASDDVDVIHGDTIFVDVEGRVLRLVPGHEAHPRVLRRYGPFMHTSSVFVRRGLLPEDAWDVALTQLLDWDLWLRLAEAGARFRYLPTPFSAFRRHSEQLSQNVTAEHDYEYDLLAVRFGVPLGERRSRTARVAGKIEHGLAKLRSGAYARQARVARECKGIEIRWFESPEALRRTERVLTVADGRGRP